MPKKKSKITHQKRVQIDTVITLSITYTILKAAVYDHATTIRDTDELFPHDLQTLGHTRLTPQQVQEFPVCWLPQSEKAVAGTGDQVAPRSGLDLM